MKYTEDNIIGVRFKVNNNYYIILEGNDKRRINLLFEAEEKIKNNWYKKSEAIDYLNNKSWEFVSSGHSIVNNSLINLYIL